MGERLLRVWAVCLLVISVPVVPTFGQEPVPESGSDGDIAGSVERLKKLREDLEESRKKVQALGGREKSTLGEIQRLEETLAITKKIMKELERKEEALGQQLETTQAAFEEAKDRLAWRKGELARALRQMYKYGRHHSLEILFSSRSFPNLLERVRFLGSVAARNRQLLRRVEEEETRIDGARQGILENTRELRALKDERGREQARIEGDVGRRTRLLDEIRTEKSKYEQMAVDLERSAEDLEALIALMESARVHRAAPVGGDFRTRKGKLPAPVEGEVVVSFGKHRHPKFGTVTLSNGIVYRAGLGSPVRAVAPGRVEHVSWLTGFGQCVILSHGDGYYTLYAHCRDVLVATGQEVVEGGRIATVGETGSLIGPCLHFEIRKGREALDPAKWIR